jgi:hypothetical protein
MFDEFLKENDKNSVEAIKMWVQSSLSFGFDEVPWTKQCKYMK